MDMIPTAKDIRGPSLRKSFRNALTLTSDAAATPGILRHARKLTLLRRQLLSPPNRRMNGQLTLLHVIPEPSALDYNMGGFPPEELAQAEEEGKQKLAAELAHAKVSLLEVDSKLQTGVDLHDEILSTAKQISADLLVLSTHGYTGWKHLLFGSDAEKILQHATCPILVVR